MLKEKRISRHDADRMIGTLIAFEAAAAGMIDMNIYNTKEMK